MKGTNRVLGKRSTQVVVETQYSLLARSHCTSQAGRLLVTFGVNLRRSKEIVRIMTKDKHAQCINWNPGGNNGLYGEAFRDCFLGLDQVHSGFSSVSPAMWGGMAICRTVLVFRRKRKRFAVSKEQNMAVYGMYDPLE